MQEENHEEEQITEIEKAKPKKELSQKQKEHLDNIRVKALERKREIKLMKNKQYEEKVSKLKVEQVEIKKEEEQPLKEEIKKEETKEETKKKKVIKKVIKYVEADSDEEEQEEIVVKPKKKIESKPEPTTIPPKELSYNELLYQIFEMTLLY